MPKVSRTNKLLYCPENRKKYDPRSIKSILSYAAKMQGLTFEEILNQNGLSEDDISYLREQSMINKGLLGLLIEEAWFGYLGNNKQGADFSEIGVELKSTPYEGDGQDIRPGETLSLTQINYRLPQEPDFYKSHAWEKMQQILIVYYKRQRELAAQRRSKLFYPIDYVFMLKPDAKDLAIIEADYKLLNGFMVRGEAEKLSRTHGQYLGVAPKSGKTEYVPQFYGDHIPALKRGYVLKKPYLTYVLQRAAGIIEDVGGTIITDVAELKEKTLAEILSERVQQFIGMDINDIWQQTKLKGEEALPTGKSSDAIIACRMLGVHSNRVEEFVKAGILPKVVVFRKSKTDNQSFRIEDFKFAELLAEEPDVQTITDGEIHGWEASALFGYLTERQYLFMVFWDTDEGRIFKGCQLWGFPDKDLETVHQAWAKAKHILDEGVELTLKYDRNGKVSVSNNLPGLADNGVFHIRPHANRSYYEIAGEKYGAGSESDSDILPNGDRMTKQAYWLNRKYIESQLQPELVMRY